MCSFFSADVESALAHYASVCEAILSTIRPRLISSLRISLSPSIPDSTLLSLINTPTLTPASFSSLPGCSSDLPTPAWSRLHRRYGEVREVEGWINKMQEGGEGGGEEGLQEVEARMREMGLVTGEPTIDAGRADGTERKEMEQHNSGTIHPSDEVKRP